MYFKIGLAIVFCLGLVTSAEAHDIFQDVLKEKYMLKSFSCKACHPDSKDRKVRTAFADRIYLELKDLGLSEKYAVALEADEKAKATDSDFDKKKGAVAAFEKSIVEDFEKAFVAVGKQTMTIDEMIKQGLFNGARLDTKKIEAAKKAAEAGK